MTKVEMLTGWFLLLDFGFTAGVLAMNGDWQIAVFVFLFPVAIFVGCLIVDME